MDNDETKIQDAVDAVIAMFDSNGVITAGSLLEKLEEYGVALTVIEDTSLDDPSERSGWGKSRVQ